MQQWNMSASISQCSASSACSAVHKISGPAQKTPEMARNSLNIAKSAPKWPKLVKRPQSPAEYDEIRQYLAIIEQNTAITAYNVATNGQSASGIAECW